MNYDLAPTCHHKTQEPLYDFFQNAWEQGMLGLLEIDLPTMFDNVKCWIILSKKSQALVSEQCKTKAVLKKVTGNTLFSASHADGVVVGVIKTFVVNMKRCQLMLNGPYKLVARMRIHLQKRLWRSVLLPPFVVDFLPC